MIHRLSIGRRLPGAFLAALFLLRRLSVSLFTSVTFPFLVALLTLLTFVTFLSLSITLSTFLVLAAFPTALLSFLALPFTLLGLISFRAFFSFLSTVFRITAIFLNEVMQEITILPVTFLTIQPFSTIFCCAKAGP